MGWATFAGRCLRPSLTVLIPAAGSQVGGFFVTLARHRITPSGPSGLTGPAPPNGPPRRSGLFRRYGYEMAQDRPVESGSNPPTTRGAAGVLGEAQAVAPQVAFSVYSVSVVYLRRMLILGSSNRGGVLAGTRYTPYTLTLGDGEVSMFQPSPTFIPYFGSKNRSFYPREVMCFRNHFRIFFF